MRLNIRLGSVLQFTAYSIKLFLQQPNISLLLRGQRSLLAVTNGAKGPSHTYIGVEAVRLLGRGWRRSIVTPLS